MNILLLNIVLLLLRPDLKLVVRNYLTSKYYKQKEALKKDVSSHIIKHFGTGLNCIIY